MFIKSTQAEHQWNQRILLCYLNKSINGSIANTGKNENNSDISDSPFDRLLSGCPNFLIFLETFVDLSAFGKVVLRDLGWSWSLLRSFSWCWSRLLQVMLQGKTHLFFLYNFYIDEFELLFLLSICSILQWSFISIAVYNDMHDIE